jgi:hypothetical protein
LCWHEQACSKLIRFYFFRFQSSGSARTASTYEVAHIDEDMFAGLQLMAQVEVRNLVCDRESLASGWMSLIYADGSFDCVFVINSPEMRRIGAELPGVRLYAKCEFMNPGGSVKDRPALRMVQAALAGAPSGRTCRSSTRPATGVAYA